jgi:hypothetical protein
MGQAQQFRADTHPAACCYRVVNIEAHMIVGYDEADDSPPSLARIRHGDDRFATERFPCALYRRRIGQAEEYQLAGGIGPRHAAHGDGALAGFRAKRCQANV